MAQLPVYVINLDRRPDRLATITRDLDRLGLEFERVAAIDARDAEFHGLHLTKGEAACALSHCAALHMFLDTDHAAAMIMEDDITVSSDVKTLLGDTGWWPPFGMLFKLDNPRQKRRKRIMGRAQGKTPTGRTLHPVMLRQTGAGAYLVSRGAAKRIIQESQSLTLPIDRVLFDLRLSEAARAMRPLQVVPAMVTHGHEGSDLEGERKSTGKYRVPRGLLGRSYARKVWVFALLCLGLLRRYDVSFSNDVPRVVTER